jgi:4,5-DOPA dioxygenase extradiol
VADSEQPKMIYDMYGFPEALYQVKYPVKGDPRLAHLVQSLLGETSEIDNTWGLDHGVWSILHKMYPKADIPVVELSVNSDANARAHFQLGQKLKPLRDKGIMIFASGNVVHNLSYVDFAMEKAGYPFAEEFDRYIKEKIMNRNFEDVINYQLAGDCSSLAVQTPEHFYPLLYAIGASDASDSLSIYNDACTLGALSMTSYLFQ